MTGGKYGSRVRGQKNFRSQKRRLHFPPFSPFILVHTLRHLTKTPMSWDDQFHGCRCLLDEPQSGPLKWHGKSDGKAERVKGSELENRSKLQVKPANVAMLMTAFGFSGKGWQWGNVGAWSRPLMATCIKTCSQRKPKEDTAQRENRRGGSGGLVNS
ncbi:uncharacterized protein LOC120322385 [Drosophila yakuba]|uniref:uncharacterized protein LOC120322385 n=1 Tax=Drosophila yakuba TaxID=7245 RepID=UPI001930874D|nr:uncharacterized protein LOC120322385 [Drosophila yakuba]